MKLQIAARLKPFCHLPGTTCVIPHTSLQVQVFPTLVRFTDLISGKKWEENLPWKGPIEGFTVELNLEKGNVEVFGKTADGFRRKTMRQQAPEKLTGKLEYLSLGKHTQLDWQLVCRRMQMEEIAPVLFQLGQQVPETHATTPLLDFLKFSDKRDVVKQLRVFFQTGFHGMMAPRLKDEDFQGIAQEGEVSGSPLALLCEGYRAIRALFFQENHGFSLLPQLPPEFHAGRLVNLRTSQGDVISMEWSKKQLKKVILTPAHTRDVQLSLQKCLSNFRVNKTVRHDVKKPLSLVKGQTLFLDRFEK